MQASRCAPVADAAGARWRADAVEAGAHATAVRCARPQDVRAASLFWRDANIASLSLCVSRVDTSVTESYRARRRGRRGRRRTRTRAPLARGAGAAAAAGRGDARVGAARAAARVARRVRSSLAVGGSCDDICRCVLLSCDHSLVSDRRRCGVPRWAGKEGEASASSVVAAEPLAPRQ